MRVAIFDFDGTLYKKETYQLLMDHLKTHPVYHTKYGRFFRTILPRYIGNKLKIYPKRRMRERSMQIYLDALNDIPEKELHVFFEELAAKMGPDFNEEVYKRLQEHHQDGIHIMVVSGAYDLLLAKALHDFPVNKIIGTTIPLTDGMIDQTKSLDHVQAERKNKKIMEHLRGKKVDWTESYAYGDSLSDVSVLELVGHPIAVRPEQSLREVAESRSWEIIE